MGNIIDYVYTKEAKVTPENVERLLPAADHFHVMGLMKVSDNCNLLSFHFTLILWQRKKLLFCKH